MLIVSLIKIILIFPFIIDVILKIANVGKNQRSFIVTPFYLITTIIMITYILSGVLGWIVSFVLIALYSLYVYFLVKKKYRKVYTSYVIRNYLREYYIIFPKLYVLLVVVGSVYLGFK